MKTQRRFEIFLPCFSDGDSEPLEGSSWTDGGFIVDDLSIPQDEPAPLPGFDLAAHLQQVAGLLQHLQRLLQTAEACDVTLWLRRASGMCCGLAHRSDALAGVGGGSLDFVLWFGVVAVQGVGVGRDGVVALRADG